MGDGWDRQRIEWLSASPTRTLLPEDCGQLRALLADFDQAEKERRELRQLFDLQYRRMGEATALWRAESPEERALIQPDLGALLQWLMDQPATARAELAEVTADRDQQHSVAVAALNQLATQIEERNVAHAELAEMTADRDRTRERVVTWYGYAEDADGRAFRLEEELATARAELDEVRAERNLARAEVQRLEQQLAERSGGKVQIDGQ